jgi:hypothetical protein
MNGSRSQDARVQTLAATPHPGRCPLIHHHPPTISDLILPDPSLPTPDTSPRSWPSHGRNLGVDRDTRHHLSLRWWPAVNTRCSKNVTIVLAGREGSATVIITKARTIPQLR